MKASELKIGGWYKITGMGHSSYEQFNNWSEALNFEAYGEGIPLTPSVLEAAGFTWEVYYQAFHKHEDGHWFYDLNECYPKGYQFSTFKKVHLVGKPIFYLHQLQNLYFALTGTELEIDISKLKSSSSK